MQIRNYVIQPGVDLSRANLSRANLSDADLSRATFCGATIDGAFVGPKDIGGPGWILYALTGQEQKVIEELRK